MKNENEIILKAVIATLVVLLISWIVINNLPSYGAPAFVPNGTPPICPDGK